MLVAVVGTTAACLKAGCEATPRAGVARRQVASQPGGASCRARAPARASSAWRVGLVGTTAACLTAGGEATPRAGVARHAGRALRLGHPRRGALVSLERLQPA